jgi:hypothetical protein
VLSPPDEHLAREGAGRILICQSMLRCCGAKVTLLWRDVILLQAQSVHHRQQEEHETEMLRMLD